MIGEGGGQQPLSFPSFLLLHITQVMISKPNTIYEIRYDFDLNGGEIEVPDGCTLKFDGGMMRNGTVVFNKTQIESTTYSFDCNFRGTISNDALYAKWFMQGKDDEVDNTETFRMILNVSFDSSLIKTGWESPLPIIIPFGTYYFKKSIIDGDSTIKAARFNIIGAGYCNTIFKCVCEDFFINNNGVFGFTTFTDISFYGSKNNGFMYMKSVNGRTVQSIIFERCSFRYWKTVLDSEGGIMNSEISFNNSKINTCGEIGNPCKLFVLNNQQAVNWRFYATDIEDIVGICFEYIKGCNINIMQGSIILSGPSKDSVSTFISIPKNSDSNSFGPNNSPHIVIIGSRFELRKYVNLFNKTNDTVGFVGVFYNVGLGGYNLVDDDDFYSLELSGNITLSFIQCQNYRKFGVSHYCTNSSKYNANIYSDTTELLKSFANKSLQTKINNTYNYLYLKNLVTGETTNLSGEKSIVGNREIIEVTECINNSNEDFTIDFFKTSKSFEYNKEMFLCDVTYNKIKQSGYGDISFRVKISVKELNGSIGDTILDSNFKMAQAKIAHSCITNRKKIAGLIIEHSTESTSALLIKGILTINYM